MKILTTAFFTILILRRSISTTKWISLTLLTIGVVLVQWPDESASKGKSATFVGFVAVMVACICSGLAGVSFEKLLKGSKSSVWLRNIHMSFFSIIFGLIFGVYFIDGKNVSENGFFWAYNVFTWLVILCQAFGGLVVSLVIKYADNILKGFATSISIILSTVASIYIFDLSPSRLFLWGASVVIFATYLYSLPDQPKYIEIPK